jgi:AraC-like DNA-binding protein
MNLNLRSDRYGLISFVKGFHPDFSQHLLPQAETYHANGPWGLICFQQIQTGKQLLRHFLFLLKETLSFKTKEENEGLQSLINLNGYFEYKIKGLHEIILREKEFILVDAGKEYTVTTVPGGKLCSLLNAYYSPESYADFIDLFPEFKKDLQKVKPLHFSYPAKVARFTVCDAIKSIWTDRYIDSLTRKYMELRLESSLFTMLSQFYTKSPFVSTSPLERKKADAAREIIVKDIKVHLSPDEIARTLHCSSPWLQKAFSKVYGMGMYHFLRRTRMEKAKELLSKGEQLKAVALEVGMKPRNFPKEFKTFFGYTVSQLKKGLR